jgi:hypothetical protein
MTPAEELRAAAKALRETASKAVQGLPLPWHIEPGFNGEWLIGSATPTLIANARKPEAEWIALASPALAQTLANLLDAEIDRIDRVAHPEWHEHIARYPLAVARALNGDPR